MSCHGRNHGQLTLTIVPGSPSGQQAYKSNVLLHTSPVKESRPVEGSVSEYILVRHGGAGLTYSRRGGIDDVQALVLVAVPLLL